MKNEMKNLEEKTEQMQIDMKKYKDVDKLKSDSADYNSRLQKECKVLEEKTKQLSDLLRTVQNEHMNLKAELESNEVHRQISTLEKKWVLLEEANYNLSEFLRSKKAETDYGDVKTSALDLLKELNAMLQTKL
jgi:intraflagellar transport protein 74